MKAAILHQYGTTPVYGDFPEPVSQNDNQVIIHLKAASVKNLDKGRASGRHYSGFSEFPAVVGVDGAGFLEDGSAVYALGITGMIAERGLAKKENCVPVPAGLDMALAAALPNMVLGAAMALKFRAGMEPGKVVLINGATGVTGKIAVQLAKYYGASKVIATGRNQEILETLPALGADRVISLKQDDTAILAELKEVHSVSPIDIVIDYLWGRPVELILTALKGGGMHGYHHPAKVVTVGAMAGETINLPSGFLRSAPIEICGSGFGSLSEDMLHKFHAEILPEMYQLALDGRLKTDLVEFPLSQIQDAWHYEDKKGSRVVVMM